MTISHADYWPGITPLNVGELEYHAWVALALTCDRQVAAREAEAAKLRR